MFNKLGSQSAAWSANAKRSYDINDFRQNPETLLFKCRICPIKVGDKGILQRRLAEHMKSSRHTMARETREKQRTARHALREIPAPVNSLEDNQSVFDDPINTEDIDNGSHSSPSPHTTIISVHPMVEPVPELEGSPQLNEQIARLGWTDSTGQRVFFSAGDVGADRDPLAESLARALRGARMDETIAEATYFQDLEQEDPLFCGGEDNADITAEDLNKDLFGPDSKSEWFPYPDKAAFLTDILFSSPRLRFSRAQQKAVLSWAKDLGADVPSYNGFRRTQDMLLAEIGDPTKRQQSGRGNVWYLNEIGDSIKKDMSNPFTRAGMTLYPEDAGNKLSEVWHGDKMLRDIPDHLLSPNIRHNGVLYYVNELVRCTDGSWFLPKRWLTRNGGKVMLSSGFKVIERSDGSLVIQDQIREVIEVSSFASNFIQILDCTCGIYPLAVESDHHAAEMPHPLRELAGARMVYSIPLAIFIDDVSGNKSKQWNKHFSCYMSNGALPRTKLENEFHVRFVATSPFASPLEIMQGVRASIEEAFEDPVEAWDCEAKEEVLLRPYGLLFAGDNPMQAELCSCAGLNTNFFCRTCKAGGTREWKQSDEGFPEVLKAGEIRSPEDTAEETFQQILTALEPNIATTLTEAVRSSGIKDALAQPIIDSLVKMGQDLRKVNPDGSSYSPDEVQTILTEELKKHQQQGDGITNPLFDMDGIDMHKDTPTEILHTILLGVVKYYWGQTIWLLEKGKDFPLFQARLNSILADGLNIPKVQADYMCQYKGGLIGKHFKTLSQIMAFAVEGLVPAELDVCINDFINITCKCSPSILISKPKFHFLLHLPFFIRRFGPAVLFSTERYEAYNAVFRACSIYSNRLTPSRDIAWSFAGIDRVKHIVTGGWWKDTRTQKWTCANTRVMRHILAHPEMAAMVGLPTKVEHEPGIIIPYPERQPGEETPERKIPWNDSLAALAHSGEFSPLSFGTIREILVPVTASRINPNNCDVRITVQLFTVQPTLHTSLHMPILVRTKQCTVVQPEDIECAVNLQHDCSSGKCGPHSSVSIVQEREATSITRARVQHTDDDRFILNTSSLHNYRHIALAIPRSLTSHSFTVPDEVSLRRSAAAQIRDKIAGGDADDPMSLVPTLSDLPTVPPVEIAMGLDDQPAEGELESIPAAPMPVILDAPVFSRVGANARSRQQQLKPIPTTLESCTNPVLQYLCKQSNELVSGRKAELLTRLR
ncbi:hypothetical protein C8F04DRAFT_1332361 [Mycena alexandri]|uniref:Uncharacterized protein n=1 Tax=Mycena alexandri TaxID=1745969 RepID=A0AAD6WM96_9AGAR|nr:hypothetical protein C8F04DRAFT_1332361 [Mycena alexandri]